MEINNLKLINMVLLIARLFSYDLLLKIIFIQRRKCNMINYLKILPTYRNNKNIKHSLNI